MLLDHPPDPQELLTLLADILALFLGIPGAELVEVRELPRLVQADELLGDPGDLTGISLPGFRGWYGQCVLLHGLRLERLYGSRILGASTAA